jgi:excisionase family DNA binding protein
MTKKASYPVVETEHLTVEDVALRLGCSVSTVWRMVKRGALTTRPYFGRTVFDGGQVERATRGSQRRRP